MKECTRSYCLSHALIASTIYPATANTCGSVNSSNFLVGLSIVVGCRKLQLAAIQWANVVFFHCWAFRFYGKASKRLVMHRRLSSDCQLWKYLSAFALLMVLIDLTYIPFPTHTKVSKSMLPCGKFSFWDLPKDNQHGDDVMQQNIPGKTNQSWAVFH